MKIIYRPTVLTLLSVAVTIASIAATLGYILGRAPSLPGILPVHFDSEGIADRFVRASYSVVLVPVWIQLGLATLFSALSGILLYRTRRERTPVEHADARQERERMLMTAEAISLLAALWVSFQGLLAVRLLFMWQMMCCGLGDLYYQALALCIVLSVVIGIRAAVYVRYPTPAVQPTDDAYWVLSGVYFNRHDPSLFVPLRRGSGWTLNFGRPQAVAFLAVLLFFSIGTPLLIFSVLLGE
jgi:uncharacterized membrane protein